MGSWTKVPVHTFPVYILFVYMLSLLFCSGDCGNRFLQNTGNDLPHYMVSHPRKWKSSLSSPWEAQASHIRIYFHLFTVHHAWILAFLNLSLHYMFQPTWPSSGALTLGETAVPSTLLWSVFSYLQCFKQSRFSSSSCAICTVLFLYACCLSSVQCGCYNIDFI
jgi:hypothetical protein